MASKTTPTPAPADDRTLFYVSSKGDPSVGIDGQTAEVRVWVPADDRDYMAMVKIELASAFRGIWGEAATVMTEAECLAGDE
jgi:hypothetical protein